MKKTRSFRWLLRASVFCVALPLAMLLIVNTIYSVRAFNLRIADSNQRTVDACVWQIEDQLARVDDTMNSIAATNADFQALSKGVGQLQAHLSSQALHGQTKPIMSAYPALGAVFIYSHTSGAERDMFAETFSYPQKLEIREYIRTAVRENSFSSRMGWRWARIGDAAYLLRFYGGRSTYLVALAPLDKLMATAEWEPGREAVASFVTLDNEALTQREFIESHRIALRGDYRGYFLSGSPERYMIIGRQMSNADCILVFLVSGAGYLEALEPAQLTLLVLSLLAVLCMPLLLLWLLDRLIAAPVEQMKGTMVRIREGDLEAQAVTAGQVLEFQEMGETFNTMMGQIKDLKIESYEKEIENQKAQLRYLQLQIRPHFFLNGLKSLYAMAQQREFEKIQRMILSFSRHIRYIFQDSMDFVPLKRELDHVRNYLQLQGLSMPTPPRCQVDADPRLLEFPIPPLSLQTFVENSVKHRAEDLPLEIEVKASVLKSGGEVYMDLAVSDNGPGFSEEVLREINGPFRDIYTEHHVGLNNVKKRMSLIYGDQVMYAFFNTNPGCVSEILIPIESEALKKEGEA